MMKRVMCLVLAVCMMFSLGITAFAENTEATPAPETTPVAEEAPETTPEEPVEEPAPEPSEEPDAEPVVEEEPAEDEEPAETGTTTDSTVRTVEVQLNYNSTQINTAISSVLGASSDGWQYKTGATVGNVWYGRGCTIVYAANQVVSRSGYDKINRDIWAPVGGGTGVYRETTDTNYSGSLNKWGTGKKTCDYLDKGSDDSAGDTYYQSITAMPEGTVLQVRKTGAYTETDGNGTIYTIKIHYASEDISAKVLNATSVSVKAYESTATLNTDKIKSNILKAAIKSSYYDEIISECSITNLDITDSKFAVSNGKRTATQSSVNIHFNGSTKYTNFDVTVNVEVVDARQMVSANATFAPVVPTVDGSGNWNYDAIRAGVVQSVTGRSISDLSGIEVLYYAWNKAENTQKYVELEGRKEGVVNYKSLQTTGEGNQKFKLTFNGNSNYQPFSGEFTVSVSDSRRELPIYADQTTVFAYTDSGSIDYATIKDNVVKAIWGEIPGSYSIEYITKAWYGSEEYFAIDGNSPMTEPGTYKFKIIFDGNDSIKPSDARVRVTLEDTRTDLSSKFAMVEVEGYTAISIPARNSSGTITWTGLKDEILDTMWTEKGTAIPVSRDRISVTDYAINDITKTVNSDYPNGVVYTYSQNVKVTFAGNKEYKPFDKTINNLIIVDPRAVLLARNASADIVYKADGSIDTAATRTAMIQAALGKTSGIPEGLTVSVNDGDFSAVTGPGEYTLKFTYAGDATYTIMTPDVDTAVVTVGDSRTAITSFKSSAAVDAVNNSGTLVTTGLESTIFSALWNGENACPVADKVTVSYSSNVTFTKSGGKVTADAGNVTLTYAGDSTNKPINATATLTINDPRTVVTPAAKTVDIIYNTDGSIDAAATKAAVIKACTGLEVDMTLKQGEADFTVAVGTSDVSFTYAGDATYAPFFGTGADTVSVTLQDARTDAAITVNEGKLLIVKPDTVMSEALWALCYASSAVEGGMDLQNATITYDPASVVYTGELEEAVVTVTITLNDQSAYKNGVKTVDVTFREPCADHQHTWADRVCTRCFAEQTTHVVTAASYVYENGVEKGTSLAPITLTLSDKDELERAYVDTGASASITGVPDNCRFLGWFVNGTKVSDDLSCSFTVEGDTAVTCKFEQFKKIGITVESSDVTINGDDVTYAEVNSGDIVELKYTGTGKFSNWVNASGRVIGKQTTLRMRVISDQSITPVLAADQEGTATVRFVSAYNQIIQSAIWNKDDAYSVPNSPTVIGKNFVGWSLNGTDVIESGQEVVAIQALITAGSTEIDVKPVYKQIDTPVALTVTSNLPVGTELVFVTGAASNPVLPGNLVTVEVAASIGDYNFQYWTDGDGKILSYKTDYSIFPTKDTTVNAVYEQKEAEAPKPTANMVETSVTVVDGPKYKCTASFSYTAPQEYQVIENGMLYGNKAKIANAADLVVENVGKDGKNVLSQVYTSNSHEGTRSLTITTTDNTKSYLMRGYIIVKNPYGAQETYYTDVLDFSVSAHLPK